MKSAAQSPLFAKTYDFLLWLVPLTVKFPKAQRFLLAERLGKMGLDFYKLLRLNRFMAYSIRGANSRLI